jgi:hypothetical protein
MECINTLCVGRVEECTLIQKHQTLDPLMLEACPKVCACHADKKGLCRPVKLAILALPDVGPADTATKNGGANTSTALL